MTEPKTLANAREEIGNLQKKIAELNSKIETTENDRQKAVEAFDSAKAENEKLIKDAAVANQERDEVKETLQAEETKQKELLNALADSGIDPDNLENPHSENQENKPKSDEEIAAHYASFEPKMRDAREKGDHAEFCALRDERHEFFQANKKTIFKACGLTPVG